MPEKNYNKQFENWISEEKIAVNLLNSAGMLMYDKGIEIILFRQNILDVGVTELMRLFNYAQNVVKREINIQTADALINEICNLTLPPSKLDIGLLTAEFIEEKSTNHKDFVLKKLDSIINTKHEFLPRDIVLFGFGRIGQEVAKIALGAGMNVIACDSFLKETTIKLNFYDKNSVSFKIKTISKNEVLKQADFITLHVPSQKKYVIDKKEFAIMKNGAVLINAARGGIVNEVELVAALDSGKLLFAALDTFENEPKPDIKILMHPNISLTPHIGAATNEAQERIGEELASQINNLLKK